MKKALILVILSLSLPPLHTSFAQVRSGSGVAAPTPPVIAPTVPPPVVPPVVRPGAPPLQPPMSPPAVVPPVVRPGAPPIINPPGFTPPPVAPPGGFEREPLPNTPFEREPLPPQTGPITNFPPPASNFPPGAPPNLSTLPAPTNFPGTVQITNAAGEVISLRPGFTNLPAFGAGRTNFLPAPGSNRFSPTLLSPAQRQNINRIIFDLNALRRRGGADLAAQQQLERDLAGRAAGSPRAGDQVTAKLVGDLARVFSRDMPLAPVDQARFARNLNLLFNSGELTKADAELVLGQTTSLLDSSRLPQAERAMLEQDLAAVVNEFHPSTAVPGNTGPVPLQNNNLAPRP